MTPEQQAAIDAATARLKRGETAPADDFIGGPLQVGNIPGAPGPDPDQQSVGDYVGGTARAGLEGAMVGMDDEAMALIAAITASPFIKDQTFGQVMTDARSSLREDKADFAEKNPGTALTANLAGGLLTGSVGAAKTVAGVAGKELVKASVKTGAAFGTVAGAGFSDSENFFSADTALDTALGTALGVTLGAGLAIGLPMAVRGVERILQRYAAKPKMDIFVKDADGNNTAEFTEEALKFFDDKFKDGTLTPAELDAALRRGLSEDGILTPEGAARFKLFSDREITPTKANLSQSVDDFRAEGDLAKRSGVLSDTLALQDEQLIKAVERELVDIGPASTKLTDVNSRLTQVTTNVREELDAAVSYAYRQGEAMAQGKPRVTLNSLMKIVNDSRGSENVSSGVITHIKGVMKNKGLLKKGTNIDINKYGNRTHGNEIRKLTVREAEEVRQELNAIYPDASAYGRILINRFKRAIDKDVETAVGADIFAPARAAMIKEQNILKRQARNQFDRSKGSFLEDVMNNVVDESKIVDKLLSPGGRIDDFRKFKYFLNNQSGNEGKLVWQDVKAFKMREALDLATTKTGKNARGGPVFNGQKFADAFKTLRKNGKYEELFNEAERQLIDDIQALGFLRQPPRNVALGSGPSATFDGQSVAAAVISRLDSVPSPAIGLVRRVLDFTIEAATDKKLTREVLKPINKTIKSLENSGFAL